MKTLHSLNVIIAVATLLFAATARALIDPTFTPVVLVQKSVLLVSVDVKQGESKDHYVLTVRETLQDKAKTGAKSFRLELSQARDEQNAETFRALAAAGMPALFFVGEFANAQGGGGAAEERVGLLHISGRWASCVGGKDDLWLFDNVEQRYQAVWAGSTDMLRRAVDYVLEDDDPVLPTTDGVSWSEGPVQAATLDGVIRTIRPIDLDGNGKMKLFISRSTGDRLLVCDGAGRAFTNITAARGLQSKSLACAWGDFEGQGRLDLASFDGKAIVIHAQQADGTFVARTLDVGGVLENGCVGLAAIDAGVKGRASLLVSGNAGPVLVTWDAAAKPAVTVLAAQHDPAKLGPAAACLVADFDGDGLADVLSPRETGSLLFRSLAPGKFAPGTACAVNLGKGASSACLGDFDGDGRFDVVCGTPEGVMLWENQGAGAFTNMLSYSGEMAYISKPNSTDCMTGDMNNDGRQDLLFAYGNASPTLFFNRGFRSFGHAHTTDLAERNLLPDANNASDGQQSACFGDFDGDGAQDMALALKNGEVWIFFRENSHHEARMAVAFLPTGASHKGPITVTGWIGKRCLGAWNVLPGVSQGYFGRLDAGPVTLKWRLPGGKEQEKEVILEKGGTVRVEIK
jgi:hypothetical protein